MTIDGWTTKRLEELTVPERRITYGVVKPGEHDENGVRFVRGGDVLNGKVAVNELRTITQEVSQQYRRTLLQGGELLVSLVGNPGEAAIAPPDLKGANIARQVGLVVLNETVCHPYVMYFLLSHHGKDELFRQTTGSVQKVINLANLKNVNVPLPPLPTQRKIASILSAYDDLIANNTRRIALLEEMAQAIYREWFVHFRYPGHEDVPLVDSPLGPIPDEWEALPLEEVVSFHIGGGWGKADSEDGYPVVGAVIRGTDIPDARHMNFTDCPTRFHKESNMRSRRLQEGDIVFEVSGGSKGQPVGRALLTSDRLLRCFDVDVMCASFCKLIRPKHERLLPTLLFQYLQECYTNGVIEQYEVQSTGIKNFKFTPFLEKEHVAVPPRDVQTHFHDHLSPINHEIEVLGSKNSTLRQTRDLLLPKLISGKLDVSDLDIETLMPGEFEVVDASEDGADEPAEAVVPQASVSRITAQPHEINQPTPVSEIETEQVMAEFRQEARRLGTVTRTELLKAVSVELGYRRLGSQIEETLKGHLRAAIRRKIIGTAGEDVWLETPTMADYEREELIDSFRSVMRKGQEYEREDVMRSLANHLGFRRLTESVREPIKSAINGAIRRDVLGYEGDIIWRED